MIIGGISHFIFGYRYVPMVADEFDNDITLVRANIEPGSTLYVVDDETAYNFFKILESEEKFCTVENTFPAPENYPKNFATLGPTEVSGELINIITSPKSNNSDRIYLYTSNQQVPEQVQE